MDRETKALWQPKSKWTTASSITAMAEPRKTVLLKALKPLPMPITTSARPPLTLPPRTIDRHLHMQRTTFISNWIKSRLGNFLPVCTSLTCKEAVTRRRQFRARPENRPVSRQEWPIRLPWTRNSNIYGNWVLSSSNNRCLRVVKHLEEEDRFTATRISTISLWPSLSKVSIKPPRL